MDYVLGKYIFTNNVLLSYLMITSRILMPQYFVSIVNTYDCFPMLILLGTTLS